MKSLLNRNLLGALGLFLSLFSFSQNRLTGQIVDGEGEGIPGVTVQVKGTTNGSITDLDGNYSLSIDDTASILLINSIGYASQEITIGDRSTIDLIMSEEISELDEIVVIGYGTQKKKVVTGAIESIGTDEITSQSITRVDQALQGRAAGVQVVSQSGQPGEQPGVKIRGIGTDGDSEPLYLVDGMAVQSLDNLNPADIASMEVLKDAASAAIYGARAANGVVLITTNTGRSGKSTVSYSGFKGVQNVAKRVDLLNSEQYVQLMSDAGVAGFDPLEVPSNNTDWQEELFTKNAPIESHNISITGGSEKNTYASSLSYFNQEGIIGGSKSNFERYTARLNTRNTVNKVFSWGNTLTYAHIKSRGVVSNGSFNGAFGSALNIDPLTPVYQDDEFLLSQNPYSNNPVVTDGSGRVFAISENIHGEIVNPLAKLETNTSTTTKDQILGSVFTEITPMNGLTLRSSVGMDLSFLELNGYLPLYYLTNTTNNLARTGLNKEFQRQVRMQFENTANYDIRTGDHHVNALVGTSYLQENWESLVGTGKDINTLFEDLRYLNLSTDSTRRSTGGASEYRLGSVFSRILYDYKDRISFNVTYRRDGSSRFGVNNRFASFWSFGGSWVINEEPFFPDNPVLSFMKLRASWGQNGNDRIKDFQYTSLLDRVAYNLSNGTVDGNIPINVSNQDVKWEESEQLNFAIESGFFDNKLTVTLDYYKKITKDLLQPQEGPAVLGIPLAVANVGQVENEGLELAIEYRNQRGDLNYSIAVNGAYNKNVLTKVANEAGFLVGADWALVEEVTRSIEGEPITSFFGFKTDGIFQSELDVLKYINKDGLQIQPKALPGDLRYVDINGDGKISDDDKTVIGTPIPNWTMGSSINLSYKNFDFSALLTGQFGNEIFNGITRPDITTSNRQSWMLDRWTETNPSTSIPRFATGDLNQNYTRATDLVNIENGSFVRIRNVQIGYNLSAKALEKISAVNWRIYVSVENLLTFTKYRGPDPEVGSPVLFGDTNAPSIRDMGIDRGIYPQARTVRLGTTFTF